MSVSQSNSSTNKAANQSRGGRWQFGLFTTVMLMTALALAIEKPIRKYRGLAEIDRIYFKNIYPREIEWTANSEHSFAPTRWINEKYFPREIETVRLNWRLRRDFDLENPPEKLSNHQRRAINQFDLIDALVKFPEATENITTFSCSHPLTPELEALILSYRKLKVLHIQVSGSAKFVKSLRRMTDLEVLYISADNFSDEQFEDLAKLNWIQWLRVSRCPKDKLAWLRERLPNTYVD